MLVPSDVFLFRLNLFSLFTCVHFAFLFKHHLFQIDKKKKKKKKKKTKMTKMTKTKTTKKKKKTLDSPGGRVWGLERRELV